MPALSLSHPIRYIGASLRYFDAHERHITRLCEDDVLLLVSRGVLRFHEDGIPYELHPGDYFIQRQGGLQEGLRDSDAPAYLYVHFRGTWLSDEEAADELARRGVFAPEKLMPAMTRLDALYHTGASYIAQCAVFYDLLSHLSEIPRDETVDDAIAAYIEANCSEPLSLDQLAAQFHFSRNHLIARFKRSFGETPFQYVNTMRLRQAERLLESTSDSAEVIALRCGFSDYSHFYKMFRRAHGLSPHAWRKEKRLRPGQG